MIYKVRNSNIPACWSLTLRAELSSSDSNEQAGKFETIMKSQIIN